MPNPSYDGSATPALNGTTIKVTGNFPGGSFQNLNNVTIDLTGAKFVAGSVFFSNIKNATIVGGVWDRCGSNACVWGQLVNVIIKGRKFTGCAGVDTLEDPNHPYDGTDASLVWNGVALDGDNLNDCGMYFMGTWAGGWQPEGYSANVTWKNTVITDTRSNGTQVRGTFFNSTAQDMKHIFTKNNGINTVLGDVGMFYINGNMHFNRIWMQGGRGYIARVWQCLRKTKTGTIAGDTIMENCIKFGTNTYGGIDARPDVQDGQWSVRDGQYIVRHNTMWNMSDSIGYWSPITVIGDMQATGGKSMPVLVQNNLGANLQTGGKPQIAMQQGGSNWNQASATGNQYFDKPDGKINTATGASLVAGVGAVLAGAPVVDPPPVVTPPTTKQRTAVSVTVKSTYTVKYDDGTSTVITS